MDQVVSSAIADFLELKINSARRRSKQEQDEVRFEAAHLGKLAFTSFDDKSASYRTTITVKGKKYSVSSSCRDDADRAASLAQKHQRRMVEKLQTK
jgi:hypothetical protein